MYVRRFWNNKMVIWWRFSCESDALCASLIIILAYWNLLMYEIDLFKKLEIIWLGLLVDDISQSLML